MPKLLPREALLSAIRLSSRPIVFVVGAPISMPQEENGPGVPGVAGMIGLVREAIQEYGIPVEKLDAALRSTTQVMYYQEAISFLGGWVNQDAVNAVVTRAVRMAYLDGNISESISAARIEDDIDRWSVAPGAMALGSLVVTQPEKFGGPILTTNFDPLLSIAIRRAGGIAHRTVLDVDGGFGREQVDDPSTRNVVHLHGYWRDSDTLHTVEQLTAPRPKLKGTLRQLLRSHMVVVVAYSGWDDVFTAALAEVVQEDRAIELAWAFYEDDPDQVESRYRHLLEVVRPARTSNRFRMYGGVDAHWLFLALLEQAEPSSAVPTGATGVSSARAPEQSPLEGWVLVDREFLDSFRAELDEAELTRYFNGQVPTWHHAVSPRIPRRAVTSRIVAEFEVRARTKGGSLFHLITGAGGEGKSTILLQVAAMLAEKEDEWRVLWRPSPDIPLDASQAGSLNDSKWAWLLVSDDGDQLVEDLSRTVAVLRLGRRSNVHILASARDTDWIAAGGSRMAWNQYIDFPHPKPLRGVDRHDALKLVRAWEKLGPTGLGQLAALPGDSARAEALVEAAKNEAAQGEGSLFGGLLKTRFGAEGLAAHVQGLMQRLGHIPVGTGHTLLEAFVYVAAIDAVEIPGLDLAVLADLLGVPSERARSETEKRLGEEAAAVRAGTGLRTRHRAIAREVVKIADGSFGFDLAEVYSDVVRQTIHTGRRGIRLSAFSEIVNGGYRLVDKLSFAFERSRRNEISVAAARAAMNAQPERLHQVVSYCRTLRKVGELEVADGVFRSILGVTEGKVDYAETIRGFYYEWSVTVGGLGSPAADAWLAGISLSDALDPSEITNDDAKLALAGLGVAFGKLADRPHAEVHARALMASAVLGQRLRLDPTARGYFAKYAAHAERLGITSPDPRTAVTWLTEGVRQAGVQLDDPQLAALADKSDVTFSRLATALRIPLSG